MNREKSIPICTKKKDDFRKITKILDQENEDYSTFETKVEESLSVFLRKISEFMEY